MKTNKRNKNLFLKKETIANLSNKEMSNVKGGYRGNYVVTHGVRDRLAMEMIVNCDGPQGSHTGSVAQLKEFFRLGNESIDK